MPPTVVAPDRNPEILSEQGNALVMPFAVDRPGEAIEEQPVTDDEPAEVKVGITSTATEVEVEPVIEPDANEESVRKAAERISPPVRTLTSGHLSIMTSSASGRAKRRKKSGGGGGWWYIRKYLKLQGLYDPDEE